MRFFRAAGLASLALAMTATPSLAQTQTTYSWPLQISQPLNVSKLVFTNASELAVVCSITVPTTAGGAATTTLQGSGTVPNNAVVNGSFQGTIGITIGNAGAPSFPPQSGETISCQMREKVSGSFSNVGSASTYKLP
jgi:hypothetical protein